MASQKQIDANRRNAEKSTGPRTAEGKAKSRRNALRDGLTGQIVTLSDADRAIFEELKTELLKDLAPKTAMERKLANAIAWDTWRLDRLRAIEINLYALGAEEATEEAAEEAGADAAQESSQDENEQETEDHITALADARTFQTQSNRLDHLSLYEQRLNRSLHRNLATLREIQAERKRNYERDLKEEVLLARVNEIESKPIRASTRPSKNGFVFSNEEVALAAVRQRYLEGAAHQLDCTPISILYGNSIDQYLRTPHIPGNIEKTKGVPIEDLVIRRLYHPEEFTVFEQ